MGRWDGVRVGWWDGGLQCSPRSAIMGHCNEHEGRQNSTAERESGMVTSQETRIGQDRR